MYLQLASRLAKALKFATACLLLLGGTLAYAHNNNHEPNAVNLPSSLEGMDLVLQIEKAVTQFPSGYPYKGAVVKRYFKDGSFSAQGTGIMKGQVLESQQAFAGTYRYHRTGKNTATEQSIDTTVNNTPFTVEYTFETESKGKWVENFGNGQLILSGSFTLTPSNLPAEKHFAPAQKANSAVSLVIKSAESATLPTGAYPTSGVVVQLYAPDNTMVLKGFGPGTLNSTGTYKYTKISANTAVEEVTQTSELFTLPYTMVYTFETPTSGTWFQNLGDGLLLFTGTFDSFPL